MEAEGERGSARSVGWMLLVVLVGLAVGVLLAYTVPLPPGGPSGPGGPPIPNSTVTRGMIVLSTLSMALLVALLVVYGRTYRNTRAPFILGLWVFLVALLLETVLTSPLLFIAFGAGPGGLGRFLTFGQLLMCVALGIFLYLSLE